MTSNQQHAHAIIERALLGKQFLQGARDATQALADAGYLMPDLPKPDMTATGVAQDGTIAPVAIWGTRAEIGSMHDPSTKRGAVTLNGQNVSKPRELAYALLAAANHAEGKA